MDHVIVGVQNERSTTECGVTGLGTLRCWTVFLTSRSLLYTAETSRFSVDGFTIIDGIKTSIVRSYRSFHVCGAEVKDTAVNTLYRSVFHER